MSKLTPEELAFLKQQAVNEQNLLASELLNHIATIERERDEALQKLHDVFEPKTYGGQFPAALWRLVALDARMQMMSTPPETTIERYITTVTAERDVLAALVREFSEHLHFEVRANIRNPHCIHCGKTEWDDHTPDCLITRARRALATLDAAEDGT